MLLRVPGLICGRESTLEISTCPEEECGMYLTVLDDELMKGMTTRETHDLVVEDCRTD